EDTGKQTPKHAWRQRIVEGLPEQRLRAQPFQPGRPGQQPVRIQPAEQRDVGQPEREQPNQHAGTQAGKYTAAINAAYVQSAQQRWQKQNGAGKGKQADGRQRLGGGDQSVTAVGQQQNEDDQNAAHAQQP